ncbi:MAG: hypothetical protein QNJ44_22635 [Rhodobacter sp.]|nr:hypothetical protein [Rhodobacter sp.]
MQLIDANVVTFKGHVKGEELKRSPVQEALDQAGFLDVEGRPLKGVTTSILRDGGRHGNGGHKIEFSRDLTKSDQPLLAAPASDRKEGEE